MNLSHRQAKIQTKRKTTPWREFVMEICSWAPYNLYKRDNMVTVYKDVNKIPLVVSSKDYASKRELYQNQKIDLGDGSFFEQLRQLIYHTPLPNATEFLVNESSDFANITAGVKNAYLSFNVTSGSENVVYSTFVKGSSTNVFNSMSVMQHSESVYGSVGINQSNSIFYSKFIDNSSNIWFSSNLVGCHECILCDDLDNQSYCIKNISYPKEEYMQKKREILGNKDSFSNWYDGVSNSGNNINSTSCSGSAIYYSNNVSNARLVSYVDQGRNLYLVGGNQPLTSMYDTFGSASFVTNHCYAGVAHGSGDHHYCNYNSALGSDVYYSWHCEGSSFIFGCVGLRNQSYCILNKQYSKEERYEKVDEIFSQMQADGTLGEFFPATMNPFYFNDTAAYLIDPSFTKEEVVAKGYLRRDEAIKVDIPEDAQVVASSELASYEGFDDQGNRTINADILKCVIQDEQGNYYRIIPMEYKFLMKHGLPLPRKHWLERMKENFRIY